MIKDRKKAPSTVSTGGTGPVVEDQNINEILRSIRQIESSGNYKARARTSSASGAYQFIDKTWNSLTSKYGIGTEYASAADAPNEIQDKVAENYVKEILSQNGGNVAAIPNVWFTGNAAGRMSPAMVAANPGVTADTYANKFFKQYSGAGSVATTAAVSTAASTATAAATTTTRSRGGRGIVSSAAAASGERKRKNKKSAKKRIRGELDKLFDKKSNRPKVKDTKKPQEETAETAQQIWSKALEKKKSGKGNPAKVIVNVVKSLRSLSKNIKTNNEQIISSIDKSASQLSSVKDKTGMFLGGSDISADMMKPQEFSIGDQAYLYYPGGPEGRQVYEKGIKGTAGKIAPREIQKQYAKRKDVDVLHKSDLNVVLGTVEDMLDNDSAIRKQQFQKLMDYIDAGGKSSSVFNLEADEEAAIMEKALTAALENIYKKHPELLSGGSGGGMGFIPTPSAPSGVPTPQSPAPAKGGFWRGAGQAIKNVGLAAVNLVKTNPEALVATAVVGGAAYMAKDLDEKNQKILKTSENPDEIAGILMQPYLMSSPDAVIPDNVQKEIGTQAEKIASQNKIKNEAMKTAMKAAEDYSKSPEYQNELKRESNRGANLSASTPPAQTIENIYSNTVWNGFKWVDKKDYKGPNIPINDYLLTDENASAFLKPQEELPIPAQQIINGNNDIKNQEKAQEILIQQGTSNKSEVAPVVNNIIASPPPLVPKSNPEPIKTENTESAFKNRIYGDMPVYVPSW